MFYFYESTKLVEYLDLLLAQFPINTLKFGINGVSQCNVLNLSARGKDSGSSPHAY